MALIAQEIEVEERGIAGVPVQEGTVYPDRMMVEPAVL
jgi:hypothetical protein